MREQGAERPNAIKPYSQTSFRNRTPTRQKKTGVPQPGVDSILMGCHPEHRAEPAYEMEMRDACLSCNPLYRNSWRTRIAQPVPGAADECEFGFAKRHAPSYDPARMFS